MQSKAELPARTPGGHLDRDRGIRGTLVLLPLLHCSHLVVIEDEPGAEAEEPVPGLPAGQLQRRVEGAAVDVATLEPGLGGQTQLLPHLDPQYSAVQYSTEK